jgi:hypothetical protein
MKGTEGRVDDYIPGVFNYCDRWCEACRLSDRCMLNAMEARIREGAPLRLPSPVQHEASAGVFAGDSDPGDISPAQIARAAARARRDDGAARNDPLSIQSAGYAQLAFELLHGADDQPGPGPAASGPSSPHAVIEHFALFIGGKVFRAVSGARNEDEDPADPQRDANGSAKAAILGVERSLAAWREFEVHDERRAQAVRALTAILQELRTGLEERFPQALLFLRPGFDDVRP